MKIITHEMITNLKLEPRKWYEWAETVLKIKHLCTMPAKTSIHYGDSYFNTMPSIIPDINSMGVKVVNRYLGRTPSLESQILLYDYKTGENLALMDASLITAMRTGAATVHSLNLFAIPDFYEIGFVGFGNIGYACLDILVERFKDRNMKIKLKRYKSHTKKAIERYKRYTNIEFVEVDTMEEIIVNSDIVISCISYTDTILGQDEWFKKGVLVIPVHLRGFQNCDLFFDKVYGDDYNQVKGFKYFSRFKEFSEVSQVLRNENPGRENNDERILVYNVGMSLHDVYAASQIYKYFINEKEVEQLGPDKRYWL